MTDADDEDAVLGAFLRECVERQAGDPAVDPESWVRRFPSQADAIRRTWSEIATRAEAVDEGSDIFGPDGSFGRFRQIRELGRGGQGEVHLALDTRLGRNVALKILTGIGHAPRAAFARFQREAELASRLDHPGICTILDIGLEGGIPYIAMKHVEGRTLAQLIREWHEEGRPPSHVAAMTRLVAKVARSLHFAHESGVLHRDVKPGNLMVTPEGEPVLLDFGLARDLLGDPGGATTLGTLMGTPDYMSPEQLTNPRESVDRRTDVWSLGVTLYEALALQRPFTGPTRERTFEAILKHEPPSIRSLCPDASRDLEVILSVALEKDGDRRYRTAAAMADDLEALLDGRAIAARRISPVGRFLRWTRREPAKAALLIVLLVTMPVIAALAAIHVSTLPEREAGKRARLQAELDEILVRGFLELGEGDPHLGLDALSSALAHPIPSPEAAAGIVLTHLKLRQPAEALCELDRHASLLGDRRAAHLLRSDAMRLEQDHAQADEIERNAPPPKDAIDHQLEGHRLLQQGESGRVAAFREAHEAFTRALYLSSVPSPLVHQALAHTAGHMQDIDGVRRAVEGILAHWPRSAEAAIGAARSLVIAELFDEALAMLDRATELGCDRTRVHHWRGITRMKQERYAEALTEADLAVALDPEDGTAHFSRGWALQALGRLEESIAAFRRALGSRSQPVGAFVHLGDVLTRRDRHEEAIAALDEALRLQPSNAEALEYRGCALAELGRHEEAIADFRECLALNPDRARARDGLGVMLVQTGRREEGFAELEIAVKLDPENAQFLSHYGIVLSDLGELERSLAELDRSIALRPDISQARHGRAVTLERLGRRAEAIPEYAEAFRLDPDVADFASNYGSALSDLGRPEEGLEPLRTAVRLAPGHAYHRLRLGLALVRLGLLDEAIVEFRESARLDPSARQAWYNLGLALYETGRYRESVDSGRRALELAGDEASFRTNTELLILHGESRLRAEDALDSALAGGVLPENPLDLAVMAEGAFGRGRWAESALWYRRVFDSQPPLASDVRKVHAWTAARAAVRASGDHALDEDERFRLRDFARRILVAQLRTWESHEGRGSEAEERMRQALGAWLQDPDLTSVRDDASRRLLPEAERQAWSEFWADVGILASPGR